MSARRRNKKIANSCAAKRDMYEFIMHDAKRALQVCMKKSVGGKRPPKECGQYQKLMRSSWDAWADFHRCQKKQGSR